METTSPAAVGLQPIEAGQIVTVRVPATTANLGPGFDTFAAAISIHMELEVVETPGTFAVETDLEKRQLGIEQA